MRARARAEHRAPTRPDLERAPAPNVQVASSFAMATAMITCQVCFEHRKGRTKYLGQADLFVCQSGPCLEENTRRKKVAREKVAAEKAAAKEAALAAKAKARAAKLLAKATARDAIRAAALKAKAKPKAAPSFFRQGIAAAEVTDDEVEVEKEGGAPTPMVVGASVARATPDSERPRSVRNARAPCRFIDAAADDDDGVEDEEVPYPPPLTLTLTLTPTH